MCRTAFALIQIAPKAAKKDTGTQVSKKHFISRSCATNTAFGFPVVRPASSRNDTLCINYHIFYNATWDNEYYMNCSSSATWKYNDDSVFVALHQWKPRYLIDFTGFLA